MKKTVELDFKASVDSAKLAARLRKLEQAEQRLYEIAPRD